MSLELTKMSSLSLGSNSTVIEMPFATMQLSPELQRRMQFDVSQQFQKEADGGENPTYFVSFLQPQVAAIRHLSHLCLDPNDFTVVNCIVKGHASLTPPSLRLRLCSRFTLLATYTYFNSHPSTVSKVINLKRYPRCLSSQANLLLIYRPTVLGMEDSVDLTQPGNLTWACGVEERHANS
ncbi:hypothetical protein TNCV_3436461 [Trichonephila clavipes]|nr:hypothetical protein TNCV_3436461 [Trichonephila clavipes]